jgi:cytoskeletal protein RodZ
VTVGEALVDARTRAGLSVGEISERTKIRESVILGIERDDYDSCGGDLFVRGYVRVIADAVGIDAQPLINSYDRAHADGSTWYRIPTHPGVPAESVPAPVPEPVPVPAPEPVPPEPMPAPEPVIEAGEPAAASEVTRLDLPKVNVDDTADDIPVIRMDDTVFDMEPVPAEQTAVLPAAAPPAPDMPWVLRGSRRRSRARARRRTIGFGVLAVVVLAAVGTGVALASRGGGGKTHAAATSRSPASGRAGQGAGLAESAETGRASAKASAAASRQAKAPQAARPSEPAPTTVPAQALTVSLAEAFGPDGTSDGDNPQSAMNVVGSGSSQPWSTDWYTSADFGMLKQGTGLLLDMGSTATITSVRVDLGPASGANVQVLAGNAPALADMRLAASVDDAGGATDFWLTTPRTARYLLIWLTRLPPVRAGQYQASIYSVAVTGRP